MPRNPNRYDKGPVPKHSLKGLRLGVMKRIDTDNPESSRTILRNLAIEAGLRSVIKCEADHVLIVLWNDKMFDR